ncbi:MAG: metallophosphoesterase [Nanoarchaeota archaeon]|nr:metallophosphoesterase [Nanoarchaeota archaeon]
MNRMVSFVIFFVIFFTIYLAMHFYVFWRMSYLLSISRNVWFYVVMIALALSFPVTSFVERFIDGPVCRLLYTLAATWLGALFLMLFILLVYEVVRLFVKISPAAAGITVLSLTLIIVIYGILNAVPIRVNEINVPVPGLEDEKTIVQLSDIHIGTIHNSDYLARIVEKTNALNPDMVLITGDFVDGSGRIDEHSVAPLKDLNPQAFFTTGNHEMYEGIGIVTDLLEKTGVKILRNETADYKGVQIIGIDNPGDRVKDENPALRGMKIDKAKPSVLMFHPPLGLSDATEAGVNLQLSGHTHAGQIMPFNIFTRMFYRYVCGLYEKDGTYLYVSPGTGTWGPPMRIGSRSEITLIRLKIA